MKIALQKNNLGGQILYRSWDPSKKGSIDNIISYYRVEQKMEFRLIGKVF